MESFENLPDEQIVSLAEKNHDACDYLLRKYSYLVKKTVRSFYIIGADSDDLIQEGMLGLYGAINTFSKEKSSFKTYAISCIRNSILDAIKSANRLKNQPLNTSVSYNKQDEVNGAFLIDLFTSGIDSAETIAIANEQYANLVNVIYSTLTKKELAVLKLYLDGLTYQEIASALSLDYKSVDNTIQKIKKKLQKSLNMQ
ncbi:MAG: sigma-70 family RNA polymerase sigma factor [Clostridia bacterium]|nr:sigma-70 family RNA polymerase sigma factor [Clostridia bacterium]MDY5264319.1 sigma-70 family RNA polymerase sigma factor [Eubacteriales bacterium]